MSRCQPCIYSETLSATPVGGHYTRPSCRKAGGPFLLGGVMDNLVIMVDGGHLRALSKIRGKLYTPDFIEKFSLSCCDSSERILRVLYYDCAPYQGTTTLPISGAKKTFSGSGSWLNKLAEKDLFAVRIGQLKFRGYAIDTVPAMKSDLTDSHFKPVFQQKGVDMRIGLDIAAYCASGAADRMALVTGDTDLVPAMKHARKSGLQLILIQIATFDIAPELKRHADYVRSVPLPP